MAVDQIGIGAATRVFAEACLWALKKGWRLVQRGRAALAARRGKTTPGGTASTNVTVLVPHRRIGSQPGLGDAWEGVMATGYGAVRAREARARGVTPAAYARYGTRGKPAEESPGQRRLDSADSSRPTRGAILRRLLRRGG